MHFRAGLGQEIENHVGEYSEPLDELALPGLIARKNFVGDLGGPPSCIGIRDSREIQIFKIDPTALDQRRRTVTVGNQKFLLVYREGYFRQLAQIRQLEGAAEQLQGQRRRTPGECSAETAHR